MHDALMFITLEIRLLLACVCSMAVASGCSTTEAAVARAAVAAPAIPDSSPTNAPATTLEAPLETITVVAPEPAPAPWPWQPAATRYLDERAGDWLDHPPQVRNHFPCAISCHTTHPYMFVRPALGDSPRLAEARERVLDRVDGVGPWSQQIGFYGRKGGDTWQRSLATEAVLNASALALHDQARGLPLQAGSLRALDRMWEAQRADGSWPWLDFSYQPWEAGNDEWGATLAAIAVGLAPAEYQAEHELELARLESYLRGRVDDEAKPITLHTGLGLLWAARGLDDLVPETTRTQLVDALIAAQRDDGGWVLRDLLAPRRATRRVAEPDGYATGLATFVLCTEPRAGQAAARGLAWLREHQRDDGSWPAWSLNRDRALSHLHMRDAATAYAVLALSSPCTP